MHEFLFPWHKNFHSTSVSKRSPPILSDTSQKSVHDVPVLVLLLHHWRKRVISGMSSPVAVPGQSPSGTCGTGTLSTFLTSDVSPLLYNCLRSLYRPSMPVFLDPAHDWRNLGSMYNTAKDRHSHCKLDTNDNEVTAQLNTWI